MRRPPSVWAHRDGIWSRVLDIASLLELRDANAQRRRAMPPAAERRACGEGVPLTPDNRHRGADLLPAEAEAVTVPWVLKIHGGPRNPRRWTRLGRGGGAAGAEFAALR